MRAGYIVSKREVEDVLTTCATRLTLSVMQQSPLMYQRHKSHDSTYRALETAAFTRESFVPVSLQSDSGMAFSMSCRTHWQRS